LVCGDDYTKEFMLVKEKRSKKRPAGFFDAHMALWCYLGMLAKIAATNGMFEGITDASSMDSEMGLPILLATILPIANGLFFGYTFHC
jgi:SSS family solute:Na+ symporter